MARGYFTKYLSANLDLHHGLLTDKSVTVQTTDKKTVEVVLSDATTYERAGKPAARTDLKVGYRVVIHAVRVKGVLQARSVSFSEASLSH